MIDKQSFTSGDGSLWPVAPEGKSVSGQSLDQTGKTATSVAS